jgi:energy-coupling factor transporter ATP-binding protein EcfA2
LAKFREVIIRQGTQVASSLVSESIRTPKPIKPEHVEPDRPALRAAEELVARNRQAEASSVAAAEPAVPADLFAGIEDRADEKQLLEWALKSEQPVHVLLVGDPGCGKSELLQRIGNLPRSRYAVGGTTSSSGIVDYLAENPKTRNLVIDDLHLVDPDDLKALYGLMASGVVNRLQHGAQLDERRTVWVFAAANSVEKLPPAVASRFVIRQVSNYSPVEAREVMTKILERREQLSPARAREIAAAVSPLSQDPRDAIQVARLAGERGSIEPVVAQVLASHAPA